jgi:N-methylhydantoinase A
VQDAAEGILTVINNNMANAIRSRTVQKGLDPRSYSLVAFGGAGPLHGVEVAALLGIPEVVVPPYPGITSAMGLLTTDLKYDAVRTQFQVRGSVVIEQFNKDLDEMEAGLTEQFRADGVKAQDIVFSRAGDLRYVGQGYELRIALPASRADAEVLEKFWRSFNETHQREFGRAFEASPIEIVNLRVTGIATLPKLQILQLPAGGSLEKAKVRVGSSMFRANGKLQSFETAFYQRDLLPTNAEISGPAIVLQKDSTTVIPPGAKAYNHETGILTIKV